MYQSTITYRGGLCPGPFVLVEFTDYYCPYCATFAVSALRDILSGAPDLQVVVRNYPIDSSPEKRHSIRVAER